MSLRGQPVGHEVRYLGTYLPVLLRRYLSFNGHSLFKLTHPNSLIILVLDHSN